MKMPEIIRAFFDSTIRVETLIHIGTMCMDHAWPRIAEEAFEDDYEDIWKAIGIEPPEDEDRELISVYLVDNCKKGFLVQFATPMPDRFNEGGFSFSWSWYTTHWIYDETYEGACKKALAWQREFIEQKRKAAEESKVEEA